MPGRRAACEERDRGGRQTSLNTTHIYPSIHHASLDLIHPPPSLMPFSAIITDGITAARGAELHLEVKTALSRIKNKFLCPEPLVRGGISQLRGSI